jgi:hypothetical protein
MAIQREDMVEQSVQEYLKEKLFNVQKYPESQVSILDAFTAEEFDGDLDKNYIAVGFNFDDGGTEAEVGSTLTRKLVTIEFFILGKTSTWGRNLKNALVSSFEQDKVVPLLNIGDPTKPVIDRLPVLSVAGTREPIADPAPWQRFIWTVLLRLEDEYQAP